MSTEETKTCRICFESEHPEDLISPCGCSGTQKHVHRKCLNGWRVASKTEQDVNACSVCNKKFVLQSTLVSYTSWFIILGDLLFRYWLLRSPIRKIYSTIHFTYVLLVNAPIHENRNMEAFCMIIVIVPLLSTILYLLIKQGQYYCVGASVIGWFFFSRHYEYVWLVGNMVGNLYFVLWNVISSKLFSKSAATVYDVEDLEKKTQ